MSHQPGLGPRTTELLPTLTLTEKAALSAGSGLFTLAGVPRLGLPPWGSTDGPNGARGSAMLGSGEAQATCVPCGSALGATWDVDLVESVGRLLGAETRTKACRVLLAPTVNLHRAPQAGRNFECFSEDPLLSGLLAAAYVRGVQSQGVITTVKHFVGNETELNRYTSNSVIDERALRELYLVPFELAVTRGGALGIMTSYNRLNGRYCTEQRWLLTDLLRGEWGFEGFVVTDWFGALDTVDSANAGLDLEMPFGDRAFGTKLAAAVGDGRVDEAVLDGQAGRVLSTFERIGAWHDEPVVERSIDLPEHRDTARRAAVAATVLLRNESVDGMPALPLDIASLSSIAVIGPNAGRAQIMGGGSANLRPFHRTTPIDAIRARLGDRVTLSVAEGCSIAKLAPLLSGAQTVAPSGLAGFDVAVYDNLEWTGEPLGHTTRDTSRLLFLDEPLTGVKRAGFTATATTEYRPQTSGEHTFEFTQISPCRARLDGEVLYDGVAEPPHRGGTAFFGLAGLPVTATRRLEAGRGYRLEVDILAVAGAPLQGLDVRVTPPGSADPMAEAVRAAASADVAVVIVGTDEDWETEGEDRASLSLPGEQDALIEAVAAANRRTVVVVNTGAPVLMPWAGRVAAVLQTWFGGQEMADALVDVLIGEADPGGRLPTTVPTCVEHTPAFGNFPGDNDTVTYAESVLMGYRWYDTRRLAVTYPFGHGLSYTTFDIGPVSVSSAELTLDELAAGSTIRVEVPVTNTGRRAGSQVVQLYVRPHQAGLVRPVQELKAFAKVHLQPGERGVVHLELDRRSFAYWDPAQPDWPALQSRTAQTVPMLQAAARRTEPGWTVDPGTYDAVVATSSAAAHATVTLTLT